MSNRHFLPPSLTKGRPLMDEISYIQDKLFESFSDTKPVVGYWLKKMNDDAYEAEDLIDDCSYQVLKQRRKRHNSKFIGVIFYFIRGLPRIRRKIYQSKRLISGMHSDINCINNRYNDKRSSKLRQFVGDVHLIGREQEIADLVDLCCRFNSNDPDLRVIAIVGMAGLGKTDLAKHVSQVGQVKKFFNNQVIWLAVTPTFDLTLILKNMVVELYGIALGELDHQTLIRMLQAKLGKEKFLVVLDDVWSTFDWVSLRLVFEEIGGLRGSTILVTSRNREVVSRMETYNYNNLNKKEIHKPYIYSLVGLKWEDSFSLLKENLYGGNLHSEQQRIAHTMIMKCDGVPLAIEALGKMLRNRSVERWKEIEKSDVWMKEYESYVLPYFKLSFELLPNTSLKKCFSYCAIFEEDELIDKAQLISMWMAQGFLQPYDKMEIIGESYIKILLDSCLLQAASTDKLGNVYEFRMHNLVLTLARIVSKESLGVHSIKDFSRIECLDTSVVNVINDARHISAFLGATFIHSPCRKLRTYVDHGYVPSLEFLFHCRYLRVLRLDCREVLNMRLLGILRHLRYLNITVLNLEMIPKEIKNLFHLQTLQIQVVERSKPNLPPHICELAKLRHIYVNCSVSIPKGLGRLTDLQTLPVINLKHDCGGKLSDLALLKKLGGLLEISGLDFINGEQARSMMLADKTKVCHLILRWEPDCKQALQPDGSFSAKFKDPFFKFEANEVLEALRPNENLSALSVYNHGGTTFPTWLTAIVSPLQSLVSLEMRNCDGEGCLSLENFRYLRILSLDLCTRLTISFPGDGFKCCKLIEELKVTNCSEVNTLPDLSPLTKLSKLWIISSTSRRKISKHELVGLASLPCLYSLWTDELLPGDLGECSPVCKSLKLISLDDYDAETLPVQLQYFVALTSLQINGFSRLEFLPDWLGKFTFLRSLSLRNMPNLKRLPSQGTMQRLHNLTKFSSEACPILNDKLRRKQSKEWSKVAHLLDVYIGSEVPTVPCIQ